MKGCVCVSVCGGGVNIFVTFLEGVWKNTPIHTLSLMTSLIAKKSAMFKKLGRGTYEEMPHTDPLIWNPKYKWLELSQKWKTEKSKTTCKL